MKNLKKSRLPLPLAMTSVSKFLVIAPRNQDILSHSQVKWLFSILISRTFIETGLFFIARYLNNFKFPPKKSSQNILTKNFQKIPPKNQKKIHIGSQKIRKILKISNPLHRTCRPKTLSGLFCNPVYLNVLA